MKYIKYFEEANISLPLPDKNITDNIHIICSKLIDHLNKNPLDINDDEYLNKLNIKYVTYDRYKELANEYGWAIPKIFRFFGYLNDSDNSISFTVINDKDVSLTEIMLELLITHEFLHLKQKEANNDLNTKLIDPVENINGYVNQWFEMEAYAYNIAYMKKKKNIDIDRGFDIIFHNRIENVYRGDNLIKFKKLIDEYLVIV